MQLDLSDGVLAHTDDSADELEIRIGRGQPDRVTFALRTAPSITWWKGIHIYAPDNRTVIGLLSTSDQDHGPSSRSFAAGDLGTELEFLKSKFAGVHTGVGRASYEPQSVSGREVTFTWRKD